jgi:hypothetical protein
VKYVTATLPSPCELIIRAYQSEELFLRINPGAVLAVRLKEHSKMKLISKVVLAAFSGAMVAAAVAQAAPMLLKVI